jgi:hypothetical protein
MRGRLPLISNDTRPIHFRYNNIDMVYSRFGNRLFLSFPSYIGEPFNSIGICGIIS